jgi:hypothetical protein
MKEIRKRKIKRRKRNRSKKREEQPTWAETKPAAH